MKIHDAVAVGDLLGIVAELNLGVSIDSYDEQGRTPLMVACESTRAGMEIMRELIVRGADVNAIERKPTPPELDKESIAELKAAGITLPSDESKRPSSLDSVLSFAASKASVEKVEVLLDAGADVHYVDDCGYGILLHAFYRGFPDTNAERRRLIALLIETGTPLDVASSYGETAITTASWLGRFESVRQLIDAGADPRPLRWNELCFAVAYNDAAKVKSLATDRELLSASDHRRRTPFILAVHTGSIDAASFLLSMDDDPAATGERGRVALEIAISTNDAEMVRWLIDNGADPNAADEFGDTPLKEAARRGAADCVRVLLAVGAKVDATRDDHRMIADAATPEIVELLIAAGGKLSDVRSEMRRTLLGHADHAELRISEPSASKFLHRTFGRRNPERMNNPFWDAMVRSRANGYLGAIQFGPRDYDLPATWCFDRYGQSLTRLPDGRYVEIGGEHEDYYDPDFCIYNDVVVHGGDGTFDIFGYPESLFPPTDFHTATLVDKYIYILGCLGYPHQRVPGFTPAYRLNVHHFAIERLDCLGDMPGWIYGHEAALSSAGEIEISGGEIIEGDTPRPNREKFRFNIAKKTWTKLK